MKAEILKVGLQRLKLILLLSVWYWSLQSAQAQVAFVWPGDANNNGKVNNIDFLHLGLAYNTVGPARNSVSQAFGPQLATSWNQTFANGTNYVYADCNGDGIISYNYDAFPIYVYYGLQHGVVNPDPYLTGAQGIDPPLFFAVPGTDTINVQTGDQISLPIHLGTSALPVNDFYGIAFSVHVDSQWVDLDSTSIALGPFGTWINNDNDRISSLYRINTKRTDLAFVRTDFNERSGSGQIGSFDFIVIGDVIFTRQVFDIRIDSIYLTDKEGNITAVEGDTLHFAIENLTANQPELPGQQDYVHAYPNPANQMLRLQSVQTILAFRLIDMNGRTIITKKSNEKMIDCPLPKLPNGVYILEVQTDSGVSMQKLQIHQSDE